MKRVLSYLFIVFYSVLVVAYAYVFLSIPGIYNGGDPTSFLTGAQILKDKGGLSLYDRNLQLEFQKEFVEDGMRSWLLPYRSPPVVAALFTPFTYLGAKFTYYFMIIFSFFMMGVIAYISPVVFKNLKSLKVFFVSVLYFPFITTLIYGQFSTILLLIFLSVYIFFRRSKYFYSGLMAGLLFIKPQFMLFAPFIFFMAKDRKKYIYGFLVSFMTLMFINILISGFGFIIDYPKFLLATENYSFGSRPYQMFTLFGAVKVFVHNLSNTWLLIANFILYIALLIYFAKIYKKYSVATTVTIAIISTILFSVHALSHDLVILLLPVLIFLDKYQGIKQQRAYLSIALLLFFLPLAAAINMAWIGVILLVLVALLLITDKYYGKSDLISPTGM